MLLEVLTEFFLVVLAVDLWAVGCALKEVNAVLRRDLQIDTQLT